MGHNVWVVDHSEPFSDAWSYIVGKGLISDSWLSKSIKLFDMPEEEFNVESTNGGEGRTEAVSNDENFGITIEGQ